MFILKQWVRQFIIFIVGKRNHIKWKFRRTHGYPLDFANPQSLSEKVQWIKIYRNLEILSPYVDKYEVRGFVRKRIGENYLIPLIGVYDSFDEIDWDSLPVSFVIKANHGSGMNILVKDKTLADWNEIRRKLNRWLKTNYYHWGGEACYKNIKRRILIENYMGDTSGSLNDYKFYCCDGEPLGLHVDFDRFGEHTYRVYDARWNEFNKEKPEGHTPPYLPKPEKMDEMLAVCRKLSKSFSYVRVDLYYTAGRVYFGELTFTPGNGFEVFDPVRSDYYFGQPFDVHRYVAGLQYQ
jgi:hypothetical protein